jgi:hypothetical protein
MILMAVGVIGLGYGFVMHKVAQKLPPYVSHVDEKI